jgi:hypothetical protein
MPEDWLHECGGVPTYPLDDPLDEEVHHYDQ